MRKPESLRVALGLDEAGRSQRLQQAIQRRPAQADAALDLQHAERRLVGSEALQDRDGAIDRADRRAFALRLRVFLVHQAILAFGRMAPCPLHGHVSHFSGRVCKIPLKATDPRFREKRERLWEVTMRWLALLAGLLLVAPAAAQEWPSRNIRVIVAYPAGG